MLVTIDESGCKGLDFSAGATKHIYVAAVAFFDQAQAAACDAAIAELRDRPGIGGKEFHFADDHDDRSAVLLECAGAFDFTYYGLICDKALLDQRRWRKKGNDLFAELAGRVLGLFADRLAEARVLFDVIGGGGLDEVRIGRGLARGAGRLPGDVPRVAECLPRKSKSHNLIQLADGVCGAIRAGHKGKKNASRFLDPIQPRRGDVVEWP